MLELQKLDEYKRLVHDVNEYENTISNEVKQMIYCHYGINEQVFMRSNEAAYEHLEPALTQEILQMKIDWRTKQAKEIAQRKRGGYTSVCLEPRKLTKL